MSSPGSRNNVLVLTSIGVIIGSGVWLWLGLRQPHGPTDAQLKRANITRSTWNAFAKVNNLQKGYVPGKERQRFGEKEFKIVEEGLGHPEQSVKSTAIFALAFLGDEPGQRRAVRLMRPFAGGGYYDIAISSVFDHYMSTKSGEKIITELASGSDPAMALLAKDIIAVRAERKRTRAERMKIHNERKLSAEQKKASK